MITYVVLAICGCLISACFVGGVYHFTQASEARKNVVLLSRLSGNEAVAAEVGLKPTRLAHRASLQQALKDAPFVSDLAELLERSGMATTVAELLGQMLASVIGSTFVYAVLLSLDPAGSFMLGLFTGFVPVLFVNYNVNKRAKAFEEQLPHAIELINLYLRSGRSFPQAFVGAADELLPPISDEFRDAGEEYRLGRPIDAAMKKMAHKYPDSLGLKLFAIAVSVLGQTGGNLVEVLERIKRNLDAAHAYGMRLNAMTGETRMSARILGALPGLFMAVSAALNPDYFGLFFAGPMGYFLLGLLLVLWLSGIIWIRTLMSAQAL